MLLSDVLGTDSDVIYKDVESGAEREILAESFARLGEREKKILKMRFGLFGEEEKRRKKSRRKWAYRSRTYPALKRKSSENSKGNRETCLKPQNLLTYRKEVFL